MKRIVTVLLASFAVCALPLAAQNAAELPALGKAPAFRAGLFGSGEASLGDYAAYIGSRAGGGLSAEFELPLFGGNSGVSVEAQGGRLFASSDKVSGGWSGSALAGVWYYLPLGKGAFAFQPELSAGVVVRGIQTQDGMQDMPSGAYVDFAVQLAPSFRFSPASLKGFEFELSPVYTIIPVQGNFVTHNVNTPLALLENRIAELVDNDSFMEAVDKDTVDDIEESVSEIHDIIQNVLISFRISDGRYMNTAQKINVSHVFESVKPQAQMKASLKQQQLVWICPPTIEEVSCNEHALRGILVNLIDNAIKFSPAQNGKVTVCAEKNKDGTIVISVNDNGPGIPKEKRAVIFEKFADRGTVPSANEKSIGLGLYVAHELAAMNGISLSYRDGETGGACFSLTF